MESELLPAETGPSTGPEPDPPAAEGPWPLPRGAATAAAQWDSAEPVAPERQNLLGLRQLQRHGQEQARFPLHRLLVTARLGEAVAEQEVAGYHRGLFEHASKYNSREPVSGLLLVCSSYVLHVVESCSSTIHLIIRDLASLQDQGPSALLQDIKVAVVAHNIPTRQFPDWNVSVVTSPVTHLEDTTESQPAEGTVTECLNLLFRVAACTPKPAEDDSEDATDSPYILVPDLQIPAETIKRLCRAKECTSPGDFLRMYLSPLQLALDSGTLRTVLGMSIPFSHMATVLAHDTELGDRRAHYRAGAVTRSQQAPSLPRCT